MNEEALREALADLTHDQWCGWLRWMIQCIEGPERDMHIARWKRQMVTPYEGLTEKEKDSDRAEADKVLALLKGCSTP